MSCEGQPNQIYVYDGSVYKCHVADNSSRSMYMMGQFINAMWQTTQPDLCI